MNLSKTLILVALGVLKLSQFGNGAPAVSATGKSSLTCTNPKIRKEWRSLTLNEKKGYIDAIVCMKTKPAKNGDIYSGAKTRFDDFQALHIAHTGYAHFIGSFFAWHRNFLALFETELETTCGYTGGIPYWNWTLDAPNMLESPLFDPVHGFGGNGVYVANTSGFPSDWQIAADIPGRSGGGCITNGPFVNMTVNLGPGNHTEYTPHCLHRDFSAYLLSFTGNKTKLDWVLSAEDFWTFDHRTEGVALGVDNMSIHATGHQSIGGNMTNMYSSPGDPLFYLHHSMLDNTWNTWQHMDWDVRKSQVGGPDTMWAYPYNYNGDIPYRNITLNTTVSYPHMSETIPIAQVMDIKGGYLCYSYE